MGTCNHKDYNGKSICTVKNDLHTVSFFDVETKVTENIFYAKIIQMKFSEILMQK